MNGVPCAVIGQAFPYTPIANPRYMVADWEFGIQEENLQKTIYYRTFGTLAITDNDLYSAYYQNELVNQISANAKLITCYVYLTPLEINNLKLYDLVVVDGVNCIISKISDYNTTTIQPTQVELIQFIQ